MHTPPTLLDYENMIKNIIQQEMKSRYNFSPPDFYFEYIKTKISKEENVQNYFNRYFNEILIMHFKSKFPISYLYKYAKSSTVWRKTFPQYLQQGEESFIKGHSAAGIFFCRLAIETALRDRIFRRKAKTIKKKVNFANEEKRLSEQTLNCLLQEASGKNLSILQKNAINKIFTNLKNEKKSFLEGKENVLNKFMHGDFLWIKDFLEKNRKITITHEENTTKEFVVYPNTISSFLFIEILEATYKILLLLYPKKKK